MRIAAGDILLALAVSLNSIELMRSEPSKLEDIFPGYNGIMPPVEGFQFQGQLRNFETFEGRTMKPFKALFIFKRGHIIFGWITKGFLIQKPCRLFPYTETVSIAFDMNEHRWITLSSDLSRKLGVKRLLDFLIARDEVAATHASTSNNSVYKQAHLRACNQANDRVDIVEREQAELLQANRMSEEDSARVIKEEYSQTYNRAFSLYLIQRGEYNIHGHRAKNN